jgi:hypothetical protein
MIACARGSVLALMAVGFCMALGAPAQAGCVGLSPTARPTGSTRRQRSVARNSKLAVFCFQSDRPFFKRGASSLKFENFVSKLVLFLQ